MISINIKSNYSLLSSMLKIEDIINYNIKENNKVAVICDKNLYGAIEFYKKSNANKLKPIIGLEIELEDIIILAYCKNYLGYKNLMKLSTIQSKRKIAYNDIKEYSNNLIIVLPVKYLNYYEYIEETCEEIYLGYKDINEYNQIKNRKNIIYIEEKLYLDNEDYKFLSYLYRIRDGKNINDKIEYDLYSHALNSNNYELYNASKDNINKLINECNIVFPDNGLLLPKYQLANDTNEVEYLFELSKAGLKRRLDGNVPIEYQERLKYELNIINTMGFCNYFLVVYDFIRFAKKNEILVGPGRGSAAGSLVAYSLGITEIDPIKYNLLFERFLNPERKTMPDIDTDFPDDKREVVIKYVQEKYGEKNVAGIVTFGTLAAKQAIRDVGRILNVPIYKIDNLTKQIPTITKDKLTDIYNKNINFKMQIENDASLKMTYNIAKKIEGFPRHTSSHAAGIVMSCMPLDEVVPLTISDTMYLTGYTMEYLEELGLLKMDFLGLKNLSLISNIINDIKAIYNENINFNNIPLDDQNVLNVFKTANTTGIFQFESLGMKNFLKKLKPNSLEDIFAAIALFRPGPADNIDLYIRRKNKEEQVEYLDESLKEILKNTYGILIYQEQIMQVANIYANYSLGEADILRRAMSKKKVELLKSEEQKFITKSVNNHKNKEQAQKIFNQILKFAGYGFNRSHSVAYSLIAYKMAYFKTYYREIFYSNLLTNVIGSEEKTYEYITEAKEYKININRPNINISTEKYKVHQGIIYFPFSNIKNIGMLSAMQIIKAREEKEFQDIYDAFSRLVIKNIPNKVIESLIYSGAFNCLGYNIATLIYNFDTLINYANLTKDLDPSFVMKPEIINQKEYKDEYLIEKEKEIFGFYFSQHPTTKYKRKLESILDIKDVNNYYDKYISIIVYIEKRKIIKTKKGDEMSFFTGSDESGKIEFICFPKTHASYNYIEQSNVVKVYGKVEKRLNEMQIIAEKIEVLNE